MRTGISFLAIKLSKTAGSVREVVIIFFEVGVAILEDHEGGRVWIHVVLRGDVDGAVADGAREDVAVGPVEVDDFAVGDVGVDLGIDAEFVFDVGVGVGGGGVVRWARGGALGEREL